MKKVIILFVGLIFFSLALAESSSWDARSSYYSDDYPRDYRSRGERDYYDYRPRPRYNYDRPSYRPRTYYDRPKPRYKKRNYKKRNYKKRKKRRSGFKGFSFKNPKKSMSDFWDDSWKEPGGLGRMPGGWNFPEMSMPNPVDTFDDFEQGIEDLPEGFKQ